MRAVQYIRCNMEWSKTNLQDALLMRDTYKHKTDDSSRHIRLDLVDILLEQ
jgi:hypothetical protein